MKRNLFTLLFTAGLLVMLVVPVAAQEDDPTCAILLENAVYNTAAFLCSDIQPGEVCTGSAPIEATYGEEVDGSQIPMDLPGSETSLDNLDGFTTTSFNLEEMEFGVTFVSVPQADPEQPPVILVFLGGQDVQIERSEDGQISFNVTPLDDGESICEGALTTGVIAIGTGEFVLNGTTFTIDGQAHIEGEAIQVFSGSVIVDDEEFVAEESTEEATYIESVNLAFLNGISAYITDPVGEIVLRSDTLIFAQPNGLNVGVVNEEEEPLRLIRVVEFEDGTIWLWTSAGWLQYTEDSGFEITVEEQFAEQFEGLVSDFTTVPDGTFAPAVEEEQYP